jgi:hypothetical protein
MLLFGMPGADDSHFKMNIAQAPQGPILKEIPDFVPSPIREKIEGIRGRFNKATAYLFNPSTKSPYSGIRLIKDNLEKDTDGQLQIDIIDYPEVQELLQRVRSTCYKVIGLSVGCENRAPQAAELVQLIKKNSFNPDVEIVLGNFGAASGKKLGILKDEENITVLSDSPEEKKLKENPWTGEGIHDMRLFLKERFDKLGIQVNADPDDPKISNPVPDQHLEPKNPLLWKLAQKTGLLSPADYSHYLALSVGCPRQCDFCNNYFMFGGKTELISGTDELFSVMEKTAIEAREEGAPVLMINFRDENFTRPMSNLVELCEKVKNSPENIRFSTFGDFEGLYEYWKKNNHSFIELSRGGLNTIWIGIESKTDFYNKRGGASPEETEEMVKNLHSLGIAVIGSLMVGIEGQTKDNVKEDIEWSAGLNLGPRQVNTHSMSGLASHNLDEPNECFVGLRDDEIAHTRNRPHKYFTSDELEAADKKWRETLYLENGPVSAGYLLILWDGYMNLKDSEDPHDIKTSTYCYWQVKSFIHQMSVISLGLHGGIFKNHSEKFLARMAKIFDDIEEATPPESEFSADYQNRFDNYEKATSPIALGLGKTARKIFSWRNR